MWQQGRSESKPACCLVTALSLAPAEQFEQAKYSAFVLKRCRAHLEALNINGFERGVPEAQDS